MLEAVLPPRTASQLTDMELDECEETTLHDVNFLAATMTAMENLEKEIILAKES
jgi:hypothetical protein